MSSDPCPHCLFSNNHTEYGIRGTQRNTSLKCMREGKYREATIINHCVPLLEKDLFYRESIYTQRESIISLLRISIFRKDLFCRIAKRVSQKLRFSCHKIKKIIPSVSVPLTHLCRMDSSTLTLWIGLFPVKGVSGYVFIITMVYRNSCI